METLSLIGQKIALARKEKGLRQVDLATKSGLSRATIDALENGRASDVATSRLIRILAILGFELHLPPFANSRPTLNELLKEDADD